MSRLVSDYNPFAGISKLLGVESRSFSRWVPQLLFKLKSKDIYCSRLLDKYWGGLKSFNFTAAHKYIGIPDQATSMSQHIPASFVIVLIYV